MTNQKSKSKRLAHRIVKNPKNGHNNGFGETDKEETDKKTLTMGDELTRNQMMGSNPAKLLALNRES